MRLFHARNCLLIAACAWLVFALWPNPIDPDLRARLALALAALTTFSLRHALYPPWVRR